MSLVWQLATRFRRTKQTSGFVSFISASSTFGIGLGCFVLILLLSVMNGFERELKDRLLSFIPHGELYAVSTDGIADWQTAAQRFGADPRVKYIQPYAKLTGMLQVKGQMKAVELTALAPEYAEQDAVFSFVGESAKDAFVSSEDGVILGASIADKLGLTVGDTVQLLVPTVTDDLTFKAPQTLWLKLVGTFSIGGELDNQIGFMTLQQAVDKLNVTHGAQGLRFNLHDPFLSRTVIREFGYSFDQAVYMSDWTRTQGHLYQDIQLVRLIVYIALTLVIAVACFNIVSGLVMTVEEKRAAIGILKTMGLNETQVKLTFLLQGLLNGAWGITVGTVLGVITSLNLTNWISALENAMGITLLSGDIYFVSFLPSELQWQDVVVTAIVAMVLCIIATLYPANKAAKVNPADALSY